MPGQRGEAWELAGGVVLCVRTCGYVHVRVRAVGRGNTRGALLGVRTRTAEAR